MIIGQFPKHQLFYVIYATSKKCQSFFSWLRVPC